MRRYQVNIGISRCLYLHEYRHPGVRGVHIFMTPGSLRHAARLETSWPRQWLRYLAAVVLTVGDRRVGWPPCPPVPPPMVYL